MWMLEFADPNQSADDDNDDDDMPDLYSSNGILGALLGKEKDTAAQVVAETKCTSSAFRDRLGELLAGCARGKWAQVLVPRRLKDFEGAVGNVVVGWLRIADFVREESNIVVSEVDLNTLRWRKRYCTLSWNGSCYSFEYFTKSPGGTLLGSVPIVVLLS